MCKRTAYVSVLTGLLVWLSLALPACQSMSAAEPKLPAGPVSQRDEAPRERAHPERSAWDRFASERNRLVTAP